MYTEEERAKFKRRFARWKAGEKVFDAGKRVENKMGTEKFDAEYDDETYKKFHLEFNNENEYQNLVSNGYPEKKALEYIKESVKSFPDIYYINGPTLPEVVVKPNKNARNTVLLTTYYPFVSDYPLSGHSRLDTPGGNSVNVMSDDPGYNLLLNNCSDATRQALEQATGRKMSPWLFTTPGDVRSFAEDVLGGKSFDNGDGSIETWIDLPQQQINKIAQYAQMLKKNRRKKIIKPVVIKNN